MRTMRTPDGWEVAPIRLTAASAEQTRLEVRRPGGRPVGSYATVEQAFDALRQHGVDPADLIDAVGGDTM